MTTSCDPPALTDESTPPRCIAYLGASLTAQRHGYRPTLHDQLRLRWGDDLAAVPAGLGGTGSMASAALLDFLVLRHRPDVCVVECSSADSSGFTPLDQVGPAIEQIVRSLLTHNVRPVLLHLASGSSPHSSGAVRRRYDRVALHYGVTTIDLSDHELPDGGLLSDGVHHTPAGGEHLGHLAAQAFPDLGTQASGTADLPPPLHQERPSWLLSALTHPAASSHGALTTRYRLALPVAELPLGASIRVDPPPGTSLCGFLVAVDDRSGVVRIDHAGGSEWVQVWDEWAGQNRLQAITLAACGSSVTVTMTGDATADRDTKGDPDTPSHRGSATRIIGAFMTGVDPHNSPPWWARP